MDTQWEELIGRVEVLINRHSPMENFEVKETCSREIVEHVKEFFISKERVREELKLLAEEHDKGECLFCEGHPPCEIEIGRREVIDDLFSRLGLDTK